MQVSHDEGVAIHIGPESCAVARKGLGEALTGERMGKSREAHAGRRAMRFACSRAQGPGCGPLRGCYDGQRDMIDGPWSNGPWPNGSRRRR